MICKNCSAEYEDSLPQCPECGMENETETSRFEAETAEKKEEEYTAEAAEEQETEDTEKEESSDEPAESESEEEMQNTVEEESAAASEKEEKQSTEVKAPVKKRVRRQVAVVTKAEKRASAVIIALMCIIGVLAAALSYVNITTDMFENDGSGEKAVVGVGFVPQEEKQLGELLSCCFSAAKQSFSRGSMSAEELIARLDPGDKGNIYSRLNNASEVLQTEADPADRFSDENGEYAYYKAPEERIDKVLELFGLESHRGENCESYYYCDGFYYFAASDTSTPVVSAEIVKSRRVLDGSYYVECYFYKNESKSKTCYMVIEMQKDEENGDIDFKIKKISLKPIFDSDGTLLSDSEISQRKTEVIEGRTKNGTLFSRYTIEYPVVEGDEAGYKVISDFFENAVSVYEMKAEAADDEYEKFKAAGGDDSQLPYVENISASIVCDGNDSISFKGVFSVLSPEIKEETGDYYADEETDCARLYERSVEAYTIDKSSGNFVLKDSVIGRNHTLISEVLYRIYNGYEYEDIFMQEYTDSYYYDEIPDDTDGQGTAIYESAWALTKQGVTFYYVTEKGYVSEVTIPDKVAKKLVEQ